MNEIKNLYDQFKGLRTKVNENGSDRVLIMDQSKRMIWGNSKVKEIYEEEFKQELDQYFDNQAPFELGTHIGNDLGRIIHAINKKYQFE